MALNYISELELTLEEKIEILNDHKTLSINGSIGDCLLRTKAEEKYEMASILSMQLYASDVAFDMAQRYIDIIKSEERDDNEK